MEVDMSRVIVLLAFVVMSASTCSGTANDVKDQPQATGSGVANPKAPKPSKRKPELPKKLFEGKVVLLEEAFKRRDIAAFDEMKKQAVLETTDGRLIPIIADWRGRAFFQDKRLRNRRVQLVGFQPEGMPYLKVLIIYTFDKKQTRQYTDYWCDICSIPTYEIKPCDCCQMPIRLRYQPQELPDYLKKRIPQKTKSKSVKETAKPRTIPNK
jgi:hypothetical protein